MVRRVTDRTATLLGARLLAVSDCIQADPVGGQSAGAALVALASHPGGSVEALQRTLGLTHSDTVRLLDRLEAAGPVEGWRARVAMPGRYRFGPSPRDGGGPRSRWAVEPTSLVPWRRTPLAPTPLLEEMVAAVTSRPAAARRICHGGACERQGRLGERPAVGEATPAVEC